MIKRTSLTRDFTAFAATILLAVLIACLFIGLLTHYTYYQKQENKLAYTAELLDDKLEDSFDFANHYVNFLSNNISHSNKLDDKYIAELFSEFLYKDQNGLPAWTIFSWISADKKVISSSIEGKLTKKKNRSARSYLEQTPIHPKQLIFSSPDTESLNKQLTLPAGIGVTDSTGKYLGTIGADFSLTRLTNELRHALDSEDLVFILLDNNFNFILSSNDDLHLNISSILSKKAITNLLEATKGKTSGNISTPIKNDNFSFNYFKHANKYPFYFIVGENTKIVSNKYWQLIFSKIIELGIMGILFIILLYYFRKQIIKPILMLTESANKIASGEDKVNIHYGEYEEVNSLADQLKEIQHAKELLSLSKNNTEFLNLNLENRIKARTLDLEKALAVKNEFLNSMSHEVRIPVQGITSISKGLIEHWHDHSEEKKFALASAVATNSQRLFSLVSNVLDLSTFNSGSMFFNFHYCDLIPLIEDVVSECKMLYIQDKKIEITIVKSPPKLILLIDSEKISQVLRNLLTNSIKFMTAGKILISVIKTIDADSYTITVKDEGIGIPTTELEQIFNPFIQSSSTKGRISGAGLGLAICKKIITGHHGKIWALNNAKKGIIVMITLPIKKEIIDKDVPPIEELPDQIAKKYTILMVDDEVTCHMSMDLLLSDTGYILISKYGGISALEYLNKHPNDVDLVFLDLMMPDMYGLNVLEVIKNTPSLQNIPVIIQSGTNDNREIENTISHGAKAYIRKPYQRQQVLAIIVDALKKSNLKK